MHFYQDERVALFIDGANLYATAKTLGFDIDYKRLLGFFRKRSRLIRAIYYTALLDDAEYSPIKPLIDWLDYNGYKVVTKPAKEFTDAMGRRKIKGNMDIELAIERVHFVLASRGLAADDLRRQTDQFIDLADLRDEIGRDPAEREVRQRDRGYAPAAPKESFEDFADI